MLKIIFRIFNLKWQSARPASCFPKHCFCEHIGNGLVRQPVDAYTNFAFVIIGLFILIHLLVAARTVAKKSFISGLPRRTLLIFGLAAITVGIGSFLYHATFTFLGMELDDDTMYLVGSFMLFFALSHLKPYRSTTKLFLLSYLILNIILEIAIYIFPPIRGSLFGLLILATLFAERAAIAQKKISEKINYFYAAIWLFLIGYVFWISDYTRLICFPKSLYQGHGLWHLLSAAAVLMIYRYYDSEFPRTKNKN